MARKLVFISLVFALIGSGMKFLPGLAISAALAAGGEVDPVTGQRILAATVQITLLAPVLDAQGQPVIVDNGGERQMAFEAGEGLGTLTRLGPELFIVTHDHWTLLSPQLARARFYSADNVLLLELSGPEFLDLIRSRDGGTLVLQAPAELARHPALVPAEVGDSQSAGWGEVVTVVYRQPQTGALAVETMAITSTTDYQQRPSYLLRGPEGRTVVPGNSGGGIWQDGRLIGNMWTTLEYENLETGTVRSSSESRAAQLSAQAR